MPGFYATSIFLCRVYIFISAIGCEHIQIVPPVTDSYNAAMPDFNLTHHFLIAMPAMQEGVFAGTLTYICEHNENGALGIVVNRPISLTMGEMFDQVNIRLTPAKAREVAGVFWRPSANRTRVRVT